MLYSACDVVYEFISSGLFTLLIHATGVESRLFVGVVNGFLNALSDVFYGGLVKSCYFTGKFSVHKFFCSFFVSKYISYNYTTKNIISQAFVVYNIRKRRGGLYDRT